MKTGKGLVHIVGPSITIDDRYLRQRCAWCGKILIDYDLNNIAVPVGFEETPAVWPTGSLVGKDKGLSWGVEEDVLPDNFCGRTLNNVEQ